MNNTLSIFGTIGEPTNAQVKKVLAAADTSETLTTKIDSPGGEVFHGLSIYSGFQAYDGPKECIIESAAMSIASYIAMAFDTVKITANGYLMIHNPSTDASGDDEQLTKTAELLVKLKASMVEAYAQKTKIAPEVIEKMMREETYLNATEALAAGFVDEIVDYSTPSRVVTAEKKDHMPFRVVAALGGSTDTGDPPKKHKETQVSDSKPVATVKQLKAKFPKADANFIVKAMEDEMTMEEATEEIVARLTAENEELTTKVTALEDEAAEATASAEDDTPEEDEEEKPAPKPAAKSGVRPVAKVSGGSSGKSATQMWKSAVAVHTGNGVAKPEALKRANRDNPGLRAKYLAEANT